MIAIKILKALDPEMQHTIKLNHIPNRIHKWRHGEVVRLVGEGEQRFGRAAVIGWSGPKPFATQLFVLPLIED